MIVHIAHLVGTIANIASLYREQTPLALMATIWCLCSWLWYYNYMQVK